MGSLVGVAWAGGRLDQLEAWVRALTPARFVTLMDVRLGSGGLVEARKIEELLADLGIESRIENLPKPFAAVATDMESGDEIRLHDGPTYPAIRASVGIPGLMSPKRHRDMWLLDGGLVNPVPVSVARDMGADVVIAVNPNAKSGGRIWHARSASTGPATWAEAALPQVFHDLLKIGSGAGPDPVKPNYFEVLAAAIDVMTDQIVTTRLVQEPADLLLNAAFDDLSILELYRGAEAIEEGRRMVRDNATALMRLCT